MPGVTVRTVSDDAPRDALARLLGESEAALETEDTGTALDRLDSAEETAGNLADDELREQLLHGCARVRELIEEDETAAAGEYVTAMSRRLENSE